MRVSLLDKHRIVNLNLPTEINGNYWIVNSQELNLIAIDAIDGKWVLKSNADVKIYEDDVFFEQVELKNNMKFTIRDLESSIDYELYTFSIFNENSLQMKFMKTDSFKFYLGDSSKEKLTDSFDNWINFNNPNIAYNQIEFNYMNEKMYYQNLNTDIYVYINDIVSDAATLNNGDIIFVEGLKFSIIDNILFIINPSVSVNYDMSKLSPYEQVTLDFTNIDTLVDSNLQLFDKKDYFLRPPRFIEKVENYQCVIDAPPGEFKDESLPAVLTMGPMIVMGMSSTVAGAVAFVNVASGTSTLKDSYPSILTAFCMVTAMVIFPAITKAYNKRSKAKKEAKRQESYSAYLDGKKEELLNEMQKQTRILIDTHLTMANTYDIIKYRRRNLWERLPEHEDFLQLRVGIGSVKPSITLKSPEEHFSMDEDNLKEKIYDLQKQIESLDNVSVTLKLTEHYRTALIGTPEVLYKFVDGLFLQMFAYHSWVNLKTVIFTSDENVSKWDKYKNTPYCFNDEKNFRFFGANNDDINIITSYLEDEFSRRKQAFITNKGTSKYMTNFNIIVDDVEGVRGNSLIDDIIGFDTYLGFNVIYLTDKLNILPNDVCTFVNIDKTSGGIFQNELISNKKTSFTPDFLDFDIREALAIVSNIPIDLNEGKFELPKVLSFLEMFNASNVKQLNSYNKWKTNDPIKSLAVPVGVNQNGDLFKLDLHEKYHGPHGLVAGMTGSGKSEFIITYILSMAVNFHPNEVSFVLIDYKGGGLAGAFENKETGVKLPHLAGTITNLDAGEINRSLSSLQSELKRRQALFNEARDKVGESTIDIYKYQKLFRDGKVEQPIPHLFIICDEFAELKVQQPEFMTQLISTARIGRSLGVHLILATQKPSGVVDDQIWSNSKFRVCLKVQDKADSNEMIKSPEAAMLKDTGRFYLQVGYNELFAMGQSAWCGAPYYESDKRRKKVNNSLDFIDNVANITKSIDNDKGTDLGVLKGEELPNILSYLIDNVPDNELLVKRLWLDRIPSMIYVDKLKNKYKYQKDNFIINPIIGEYDAPIKQKQGLLTLPISKNGNTLLYGTVGSGKDLFVSTLIYSLITNYGVAEINIYGIDFGAETLRMYQNAPQVGGIVFNGDKDKIANLFKLLKDIIEERKRLFVNFNGNYNTFIKNSPNKLPNVVLILNNFEGFNDSFGTTYFDDLVAITRDGVKYGVFVVTTVTGINGMRSKLSQNFGQQLTLQMNDDFDYRSIIGRTSVTPSKINGRGLVSLDNIYEFQTAYVDDESNIITKVKTVSEYLNKLFKNSAIRIPELPKVVTTTFLKQKLGSLKTFPIGIEKESLNIRTLDIKNNPATIISSQVVSNTRSFVASTIAQLKNINNINMMVFDAERLLRDEKVIESVNYYGSSFENVISKYSDLVAEFNSIYEDSDFDASSLDSKTDVLVVFVGMERLKTILGDKFTTLVANNIDLSKKLQKFNYVFVDSVDCFKKMEYDGWYKSVVNSTRGIWIGNGITEQSLFRLNVSPRNLINSLPAGFGYDIVGGNPCLIKYVESYEQDTVYDTL